MKEWQAYFRSLASGQDISHRAIQEQFRQLAKQAKIQVTKEVVGNRQEAVDRLIIAYRRFGHLNANLDPLGSVHP